MKKNKTKIKERADCLSECLRAAGEGNRLKILCLLFKHKKHCVSAIAQELGMSVAITSHHLRELSDCGLAASERNGKEICYFLAKTPLAEDLKKLICKYK